MKPLIFVVSPPRSGTTTACEMARICGVPSLHTLYDNGVISLPDALNKYRFFADTPFFDPSVLWSILKSDLVNKDCVRFLYLNRPVKDIRRSLRRLFKTWLPPRFTRSDISNDGDFVTYVCYEALIPKSLVHHKRKISMLAEVLSIPVTYYWFDEGWGPFCELLECPVPDVELPHLNRLK